MGDWSDCNVDYKFDTLHTDVRQMEGQQKRIYTDKNGCVLGGEQTRDCLVKIDVNARETTICNESYVELYEKDTGGYLSSIKDRKQEQNPSVDINLAGKTIYCEWCFNGVRDNDETDVDCGGSCEACEVKEIYKPSLFARNFDMLQKVLQGLLAASVLIYLVLSRRIVTRKLAGFWIKTKPEFVPREREDFGA